MTAWGEFLSKITWSTRFTAIKNIKYWKGFRALSLSLLIQLQMSKLHTFGMSTAHFLFYTAQIEQHCTSGPWIRGQKKGKSGPKISKKSLVASKYMNCATSCLKIFKRVPALLNQVQPTLSKICKHNEVSRIFRVYFIFSYYYNGFEIQVDQSLSVFGII